MPNNPHDFLNKKSTYNLYWVNGFGHSNLVLQLFEELVLLSSYILKLIRENFEGIILLGLELQLELEHVEGGFHFTKLLHLDPVGF